MNSELARIRFRQESDPNGEPVKLEAIWEGTGTVCLISDMLANAPAPFATREGDVLTLGFNTEAIVKVRLIEIEPDEFEKLWRAERVQ